ncbi:hypothetical protein HT136_08475 [Novosphingobium profundi]|uniref:hypothetical protein n=1 Tax=Novosphingobium profundi TaxID=1774954 RepID=UPI001BD9B585|nr:hypothetical protein [Novosphingobium profundi]MBT0668403.1 hypothetical protein [Novosphingobium profundi]
MTHYAYFKSDGSLLSVCSKQADYRDASVIEVEVPEGTSGNSIYLDLATMSIKEKEPFALTIEYNKLSNLPTGTHIIMKEGEFTVDDGSIEFDADVPESLMVFLNHPCFLSTHIEVPTGPEAE